MLNKKSELFLKLINESMNNSGFLNVYKRKSSNIKGFKWIYIYKDNGKNKNISNIHLFVLKNIIESKNFPWKVIDEFQAKKSIKLEESKYYLFDNGYGILFLDIVDELFNPFNGFWRYKFNKIEFFDIDLENLKKKVLKNNLPWIILDEKNASNSFKQDLSNNFESGIFMVNKIRHEKYRNLFQWVYVYKKEDDFNFIVKDDLIELKNKINSKIVDTSKFKKSKKENELNLKNIEHRKWSYTGIYRVSKRKKKQISQGFLWVYRFKKNGNFFQLSSTNLTELKKKVISNNLEWIILDHDKCENSFMQNQKNCEKFGFSTNNTGIYRVHKTKIPKSKQGFYWTFSQTIDNETFKFQSVNLIKLKQKVLDAGFEWIVVDSNLEKKSFEENEKNMKEFYD